MERPAAYTGHDPYVFVSYSHRDSDRVWPLILKMQGDGYRIWYDDGLCPAKERDAAIAGHIRECSFFLAFLTENYLESENCCDELAFVREMKKGRALIYLEEVSLPDAMRMRLGRLQAVCWNRDGEKKAYRRLLLMSGLSACRSTEGEAAGEGRDRPVPINWNRAEYGDLKPDWIPDEAETAEPLPPAPEEVAPAGPADDPGEVISPPVPPEERPDGPAGPEKDRPPAPAPSHKTRSGRKRILPLALGLVLLLAICLFFLNRKREPDPGQTASSGSFSGQTAEAEEGSGDETGEEDQEDDPEEKDAAAGAVAELASSVYEEGNAVSEDCFPFAGILVAGDTYSYTFKEQQELDYNGEPYQVARLPFVTISSYDDQRSMILGFYDAFDGQFFYYGTWSIEGDTLTVSPGGSPGSFAGECAPLTETLSFPYELRSGYLRITLGDYSVDLNGTQDLTGRLVLRGSLCEGSPAFDGMQSLYLVMDLENEKLLSCELILENGRRANVSSFSYWSNIHTISLNWESETYTLNGREVTDDTHGFINLAYINQYPGGFIVVYTGEEYQAYYYQDLSDF